MASILDALRVLGEALGVELEYTDNWGKVHSTSGETIRRILEMKGVKIADELMAPNSPTVVVSAGQLPERYEVFLAHAPKASEVASASGSLDLEAADGRRARIRFSFQAEDLDVEFDQGTGLVRVAFPFPRNIEIGAYVCHTQVMLDRADHRIFSRWLVCPEKAFLPPLLESGARLTGVAVALYGIRSETNWGVGDFQDLKQVVQWAERDLAADFIGLNPLHALFNRRPYNSSPYLPSSRLYRNFIYLDIPGIPDFSLATAAVDLVNSAETRARIERLRLEEQVNYEEVSELKLAVLREVFKAFLTHHGKASPPVQRWLDFKAYRDGEGEFLERFATFCALRDHFSPALPEGHNWRDWPAVYHDPESEEVRRFREENEEEILFWMYVQWLIEEQLADVQTYAKAQGMSVGLYNDLALAVDRNGADFWAWQEFFYDGFRVGAPPDAFAPDGQDWGFPPPNTKRLADTGYDLLRKQLRANCLHAGALRIDHVMQFHHLFWIPPDGTPAEGVYVKDRESELLNLLALESRRCGTLIVGEDLGTVALDFRDRLMAKGVFSYRLFYFERDRERNLYSPHEYPRSAIVSITTHDLPTLAGFWAGLDIDLRRDIGALNEPEERAFRDDRKSHKAKIIEKLVRDGFLPARVAHAAWEAALPTDELHSAVLRFLFHTPSLLVVINQEDVFLDTRQQNLPGTTWQRGNWVTKLRYRAEELRTHPEARRLSAKFKQLLQESGRKG